MQVAVWRVPLSLERPVDGALQRHATRDHVYVAIQDGDYWGFGEISPQPDNLNGDPSVDAVCRELGEVAIPQLEHIVAREGRIPPWSRVCSLASDRPSSRWSFALVEMALLDLELRRARQSIEDVLPRRFATEVVRSTTDPAVANQAWARLKVSPTVDVEELRRKLLGIAVPIVVDFNCSATTVQEVLDVVDRVREAGAHIAVVEQPFAAGNLVDHAILARQLDCAVSLDEGVRHRRDVQHIVQYGAAQWICVKPPRVGGVAQARTLISDALARGLSCYVGGFFESPLARRAHRALAEHFEVGPSDVVDVDYASTLPVTPSDDGLGWSLASSVLTQPPLLSSLLSRLGS